MSSIPGQVDDGPGSLGCERAERTWRAGVEIMVVYHQMGSRKYYVHSSSGKVVKANKRSH